MAKKLIYPTGYGFLFPNKERGDNDLGIVIEDFEGVIYYYFLKGEGEYKVGEMKKRKFEMLHSRSSDPYRVEPLLAKPIGWEKSANMFGMRDRKIAFQYSVMKIEVIERARQDSFAFVLSSIASPDTMIKMVAEEVDPLIPIRKYKWKRRK
jgi:hypothetical protein